MTLFVDPSELFNEQCCTSTSSSDFTCEDLAKCPKIIEIEALLPTEDQKDAMDNANAPDATNPFATMADVGGSMDLQQVTDNGNTTTNDIQLINDAEVIFGSGGGVLLDNGSRLREGTIDAGFGGSKGIAQICAVGYELKWEAGRLYVMDGNGVLIRHSLYNFTTVPSATDDSTKGYYVGSLWTLDSGVSYICTDSTSGAATWNIYQDYSLLVPYIGATSNIDIGVHDFTTSSAIAAGSFNAVVITPPLGIATLTISDSKTLTVPNDATVSGTNTGDQDLSALAPLASPTFTGTVVLPSTTSIGTVSNTEIGYLDGVTSAIQTQLNGKQATLTNPITGTGTNNELAYFNTTGSTIASLPTATYPSLTELSYVKGVTQSIQPALTDTRTRKVAVQSNTDASTSATIAETVLKTLLVPTLGANTTLKIMSQVGKVGVTVNAVFKMYYNTTPDLSGSPVQIALLNFTLTQVFSPFQRDITNKNSVTANSIFNSTLSSATEIISTSARTDLNIDLSGKYIVITGKAGSVLDSVRVDNARLLIEE